MNCPPSARGDERPGPVKILFIISGTVFTALGFIGVVVPLLPTTPFLLLAAACYARGSKRFYHWLLNNRVFGSYIRNFRAENGIPLFVKIGTISLLWLTILFSAFLVLHSVLVRIVLIGIAVGVTIHILLIPTLRKHERPQ